MQKDESRDGNTRNNQAGTIQPPIDALQNVFRHELNVAFSRD